VADLSSGKLTVKNASKNIQIPTQHPLNEREIAIIKAGGALAFAKANQ